MKVCIIGTTWPYRGGLAAMNERLAQEFVAMGHEVEIYTFTLQYPNIVFPGKSQYDDREKPPFSIKRAISSINPLTWWTAGREIQRKKPDLVVIKYWIPFMAPCFGSILRLIGRNKHTRVVSILDNLIPHERHLFDTVLNRYFVNSVDGFVALSQSVLDDINAFDRQKPRKFSPHPVYDSFGSVEEKVAARKRLGLKEDGKYLLFFGFIRDYKGLDLLLEAMAEERIKGTDIRLMVAGEFYSNEEKYMSMIDRLGIREKLELFTQFIPDDEIAHYFNAADCIVQPYKTATQSGVTQIAYHFEKPMIVTNVGGLPEIVPHGKVGFVAETNPASIAECIEELYSGDLKRFTPYIQEKKKEYSWETMVNNILNLLR